MKVNHTPRVVAMIMWIGIGYAQPVEIPEHRHHQQRAQEGHPPHQAAETPPGRCGYNGIVECVFASHVYPYLFPLAHEHGIIKQTETNQEMPMTIASILSGKGHDVVALASNASVKEAVELLVGRRIGCVPVVDGGEGRRHIVRA
jgi:CBS domain-containing protein